MIRVIAILILGCALARPLFGGTLVQFDTSIGSMVFELYDEEKPQTVELFLTWLNAGNYAGTYIHRATNNYIAQAGRYGVANIPPFGQLNLELPTSPDGGVPNEFDNGKFIPNTYGTISMIPWNLSPGATNGFITSWFVFNLGNNTNFDSTATAGGLPVFGQIVSGFETFALLNPTNGNPALRLTNLSETLSELPVRSGAGASITYDDLIYVNLAIIPEPGTAALFAAGTVLWGAAIARRRLKGARPPSRPSP